MFDTIFGLPVHALVMHVVVVLVPLAAAGVVAIAAVPRWRERFGVVVLAIATAGLAAAPVATRSGGELEDRLGASGVVARQINHHQEWGQRVIWPTLAMWLLAVVLVLMHRQGRQGTRSQGRRRSRRPGGGRGRDRGDHHGSSRLDSRLELHRRLGRLQVARAAA